MQILILCCDGVNGIPVDCHTHNGKKNVFICKRTVDLDPTFRSIFYIFIIFFAIDFHPKNL